ncbi:MAG: hypothetical protein CBD16_10140 [Betaproteobacteria bacterium TMED156]|nr:MAG: hypothetical protein CBD16_10140 [Betaproteobacteria bacterium TMED156]
MANTKVTSSLIESGAINASHVTGLTSAHIAEGSNLYYTDARSRASISVGGSDIAYNSSTGVITGSRPTLTQILAQGNSTGSNNILVSGSQKIQLNSDFELYNNGSSSIIKSVTDTLYLNANSINIADQSNSNSVLDAGFAGTGVLRLKYQGNVKLQTTSTGVTVTGTAVTDLLKVNSQLYFGSSSMGRIEQSGSNWIFQTYASGAYGERFRITDTGATVTNDLTVDDLTVTGDLNITGDINSYNVTDLDVVDKTITLGKGQTAANSDLSGITIDGSNAQLFWSQGNTRWQTNNSFLAVGDLTSYQTDNAVIMVESAGDYFPSYKIRRTGGSSKTNYTWEFQIGSTGFLNFKDITNSYYPIILNTSGDVLLGSDTSGQNPTVKIDQAGTNLQVRDGGELRAYRGGNSAYAALLMDTGETLYIKNSWGNKYIVLNRDGEVGIGTNNPTQQLDVRGGNIMVGGFNGGNDYGMLFTPADASSYWHIYNDAGGELVFGQNITIGSSEHMRLDGSGNLGIGTNNPQQRLQVDGGNIRINHPDSGGAPAMTATMEMYGYEGRGVGIKMRDSANSASGGSNREWFVGTGYAQSGFNIGYSSTGSQSSYTAQNKLTITTAGLVGIATSNPGYLLDIGSSASTTSNIFRGTVNGDFIFTLAKNNTNLFSIRNNTTATVHLNTQNNATLALGVSSTNNTGTIEQQVRIFANGTMSMTATTAGNGSSIFSTGAYASGQGDNKTHFGYNVSGSYFNYIRGANTVFSGPSQFDRPVTISNNNDDYNFKAMAGDADSWFGVYDDANNSANIIVTRSNAVESFKHVGHTGETIINATSTGLQVNSTSNSAVKITGNSGGLNFTTGANQRIYFGGLRGLEGNSGSGILQLGEGFTSCLYQMAGNVFYGNITPSATNTYDLGSSTHVWRDLYIGDLNLNNETRVNDDGSTGNQVDGTTGNWTIQEGEEHLYIINNKNGKKYKFALEEIE